MPEITRGAFSHPAIATAMLVSWDRTASVPMHFRCSDSRDATCLMLGMDCLLPGTTASADLHNTTGIGDLHNVHLVDSQVTDKDADGGQEKTILVVEEVRLLAEPLTRAL